jgi:L-threonylcarbamoyladenylate synthase
MDIIESAVSVLSHDGLIVYPTDTVYGLGGDALSDEAIAKVYEAKNRPVGMPISVAVSDFDMLASVSRADPWMQEFIGTFLPGPVTVVLPARKFIPEVLTGGTGLIGVRIPANDIALQIIRQFDGPITATSANLHGARDPVSRDQVTVPYELFVEGGKLPGTASTVVDLQARTIIRRGTHAGKIEEFLCAP